METQAEILQLLQQHINKFPSETAALNPFIDFVNKFEGEQLFDRKNFTGHITASAFIIDQKAGKLLLLKHKFLNRWLQPGGHVDSTDISLLAAARREAQEETGIAGADLLPFGNTVFDFDSHFIPENLRKQEPSHFHHDARFLFISSKEKLIDLAEEESTDSKWIPFAELANDADFGEVVGRIQFLVTALSTYKNVQ